MAEKSPKKPNQKKQSPRIPGLPKDAKVKVIEITPRTFIIPLLVIALIWSLYSYWVGYTGEKITYNDKVGLNEIRQNYQSGSYEEIMVSGNEIKAKKPIIKNNVAGVDVPSRVIDRTIIPQNVKITDIGFSDPNNKTKITIVNDSWSKALWDFVPSLLMTILFVAMLVFFMGRVGGGGMGGPMAFIRSRARVYDPEMDEKVTFADVAGSDEEKDDLVEIVDFLKNPSKYKDLGAKIPRGILLQ